MSDNDPQTPYGRIVHNGYNLLLDLFAQIINLLVSLNEELNKLQQAEAEIGETETTAKKHKGSPVSVRALKTSIVLLQFNALETLSNFLAEVALQTNQGVAGSPPTTMNLSQIEIDFLSEQRTILDVNTGRLKSNRSAFVPTLDKIAVVPLLLLKLHGIDFRLDKGSLGWQKVVNLKNTRDKLTHVRLDISLLTEEVNYPLNLDNVKPAVTIESKDLFEGVEAIRWYFQQITPHLHKITVDKKRPF